MRWIVHRVEFDLYVPDLSDHATTIGWCLVSLGLAGIFGTLLGWAVS